MPDPLKKKPKPKPKSKGSDSARAKVREEKRKMLEAGRAAGLSLRQIAAQHRLDLNNLSTFASRHGFSDIPKDHNAQRGWITPSAEKQLIICKGKGTEMREHAVSVKRMPWVEQDRIPVAPRPETAPRMPIIRQDAPSAEAVDAAARTARTIETIRELRDEYLASVE